MKILVINGPNLNMLGLREPDIYGKTTYADLCAFIESKCTALGCECELYQSNHEGDIVDKIQAAYGIFDAIVINPGGYTHTSVAILDALKAVAIPTAEVHISDVDNREELRKFSYISYYAEIKIAGHGINGYAEAIEYFVNKNR